MVFGLTNGAVEEETDEIVDDFTLNSIDGTGVGTEDEDMGIGIKVENLDGMPVGLTDGFKLSVIVGVNEGSNDGEVLGI